MGCQSNGMSKQWDVKAMGCQGNGMSRQWDVKAMVCQGKGNSKQWDAQALGCHSKASFSHLHRSDFHRSLAGKLRFQIFNFEILREVSHESFVLTSSTFIFEGGLTHKLRFHIFNFHFVAEKSPTKSLHSHLQLSLSEGSLAHNVFLKVFCRTRLFSKDAWRRSVPVATVSEQSRLYWDHGRIGPAL